MLCMPFLTRYGHFSWNGFLQCPRSPHMQYFDIYLELKRHT